MQVGSYDKFRKRILQLNKSQDQLLGNSLYINIRPIVMNLTSKNCLKYQIWQAGPILYPGMPDLAARSSTQRCQNWQAGPLPRDARSGKQVHYTQRCQIWQAGPLYLEMPDLASRFTIPRDARFGRQVNYTQRCQIWQAGQLYLEMPDLAGKSSTQIYQMWQAGPLPRDARSGRQVLYADISDLAGRPSTQRCQIWYASNIRVKKNTNVGYDPLSESAKSGRMFRSVETALDAS